MAVKRGSFREMLHDDSFEWIGTEASRLLDVPRALFYLKNWPLYYRDLASDEGHGKAMIAVCDALLDGTLTFDVNGRMVDEEEQGS